jgi:hypothetical protein
MNGSVLSYALKFSVNTVLAFAVVMGGLYLVDRFAPALFEGGMVAGAAIGALMGLVLLPILAVAKAFYQAENRHVTGMEGLKMSVLFAALTLVILAVGSVILNQLMTGRPTGLADTAELTRDPAALAALIGGAFVALALVYRLFLWAGIRGEIVRAAKGRS